MTSLLGVDIYQQLITQLTAAQACFRVIEHEPVGKCEAVSVLRGTAPGQGAKALVCHVKGNGVKQHVLAVLNADLRADLAELTIALGGLKASLASPDEVDAMTGCVFGAIPPFSFHSSLRLVADALLFTRYEQIASNAGRLDRSVVISAQDYLRIAQPTPVSFHAV